jgi:hypothetical protein
MQWKACIRAQEGLGGNDSISYPGCKRWRRESDYGGNDNIQNACVVMKVSSIEAGD